MAPTLLVLAGLMIACGAAGELAEGEIALSAPQCELLLFEPPAVSRS
jgi:hypothetical protein